MSSEQKPSVGRIVHYVSYGTPGGEFSSECRAAVVTQVVRMYGKDVPDLEWVGLAVLNPSGVFFNESVPRNDNKVPGTWHWPERV